MYQSIHLSPKQQLFADAFLTNGFKATEAARSAGYSCNNISSLYVTAWRLLRNAKVQAYIDQRLEEYQLTARHVLAMLSDHARANLLDFISWNENREYFLDLEKAKRAGKMHLIKRIRIYKDGFSIELIDTQAALIALAKYHKLFSDTPPFVSNSLEISEEIEEMIVRIYGNRTTKKVDPQE